MSKNKKVRRIAAVRARNWYAVHAFRRNAASPPHKDKKKEAKRNACRGRVKETGDE